MLQLTTSEIEIQEKIAEAEVAAHFEIQGNTADDLIDEKHEYDINICQLVQAEIARAVSQTRAGIQSMIVNKSIYY